VLLKCDGTRAETRFCLTAKRTSPFKSAGALVQSTSSKITSLYVMWRCGRHAATSPNLYNDIMLPSFFNINVTLVR